MYLVGTCTVDHQTVDGSLRLTFSKEQYLGMSCLAGLKSNLQRQNYITPCTKNTITLLQHSAVKLYCSSMQCSSMQYSAVQCSTVQCNAVQCSSMQYSAVQFNAVQCSSMQCSSMQCSAVQFNAVSCSVV